MQQAEIKIVCTQLFHRVQNRCFGFLVSIMLNPDLSGQENVFAVNTGFFDCCADLFFIEIALRRINGTIANL